MDIIISANEKILKLVHITKSIFSKNQLEKEYAECVEKIINNGICETKKSQFNYVCKNKSNYIVFNTMYNSLTRLSEEEYNCYLSCDFNDKEKLKKFISQGIFVYKDINELEQYNLYIGYADGNLDGRPNITVTPTMECNARCFYCYEEGVRCGRMSETDAAKIVDFIKTLDYSKGINLTWFGGEPLMNPNWMDEFSECLRKAQIDFSAFIITNGSRIDDVTISKMVSDWNIKSVQITLDGSYEEYYRRKSYTDKKITVYYEILKNIKKLTDSDITVQIRMNIDKENMESIISAVEDLSELYKENLKVKCYPAFLQGSKTKISEREKVDFIKRMIDAGGRIINVNEYLYKLPKLSACYHNQSNAFSIDVNGDIFTCEHFLGRKHKAIGNINNIDNIRHITREVSADRDECQRCVFLPKCQGGCIDAYNNGENPCFIDKYIIKAYLEII